jgi:ASC-1-like (ASCH) protein
MSKKVEKKIWPEYFEKVKKGIKTFEVRLADWECNEGDILVLREWNPETKKYTGREIEKKVVCVVKTKNCNFWTDEEVEEYGYQIIGIK